MLSEILHDLISATTHRVGLDRAAELHELADKLDSPVEADPEPTEQPTAPASPAVPVAPKPAARVAPGA